MWNIRINSYLKWSIVQVVSPGQKVCSNTSIALGSSNIYLCHLLHKTASTYYTQKIKTQNFYQHEDRDRECGLYLDTTAPFVEIMYRIVMAAKVGHFTLHSLWKGTFK